MSIFDRGLDYLVGFKPPSQGFPRGLFLREVGGMEALLGVETPPNKTLELFALSLSGRCRIAFSRLGFPKSDVVMR
jgi:hypothetical protein